MQRMEQQIQRAVEAAKARPKARQLVVEGSLGKIAFSNSKTPRPLLNRFLGVVVNLGRSLPFIILLVLVAPVTRGIVGTTIGSTATIVPLTIGAVPFLARLVETSPP